MLDWPTAGVIIAAIAAVSGMIYPFLQKRGGGSDMEKESVGRKPHECIKHAELAQRVTKLESQNDHTVPLS